MSADLELLRAYVTAKDGMEYAEVPEGIVLLHITHSNLQRKMVDIRLDLHASISEVKYKVYRHTGTKPETMDLYLVRLSGGQEVRLEDSKKLGFYSPINGERLHVVDSDPFSLSRGGGLEDTSLIQKYEISEDDYDKREKTVRAYKREQLAKDPNWKPKTTMDNRPKKQVSEADAPGPESISEMAVGNRCEVQPGSRRGQVMYLGLVPEIAPGYWVGVKFDEPVGKGDGSVKGTSYFECASKYGGFIRPHNVAVGDFPVEDPFADLSDEEL